MIFVGAGSVDDKPHHHLVYAHTGNSLNLLFRRSFHLHPLGLA